ncbi:MAG: hypothetical protein V1904_11300 [Bacteroidota bacterium]
MDRKIILHEISQLLETITEQTQTLQQYSGTIPQIEMDIILANIRELYEKYRDMGLTGKFLTSAEKTEKHLTVAKEEPVFSIIPDKPVTEKEIMDFEKTLLVESMTQYSILSEKNTSTGKKEQPVETDSLQKKTKQQKKSSPDLFSGENTLADKFKDEKKSLNEKLSDSHTEKSIASKLQKNPIKDMKTAIGINEKFMFINELFEGSLQKYNENINSLNSQKSKTDALKLMELLKNEYSWKADSDAYTALAELVLRRYL